MFEEPQQSFTEEPQPESSAGFGQFGGRLVRIVLGVAAAYVLVSVFFTYQLNRRIAVLESKQAGAEQSLRQAETQFHAAGEAIAQKLGMTHKEFMNRTSAIVRQQKAAETRLAEEAKKQQDALAGQVASVRSDFGGLRNDAATLRSDLEATKARLEQTIGDLGIQSGLIATTRDQLDVLKQRGERNYFEFTLSKGGRPMPVNTVSLQLKKTNQKKGKFTLNVISDDKTIEKKDRNLNEPVQFYTGRDRNLYELVVFAVEKDKVTGYLATPKTASLALAR
jgi:hypothetical protein